MRLVRIAKTVWDVLAIDDPRGRVIESLESVAPGDKGAEDMRALLESVVPDHGPQSDRVRSKPIQGFDGLFEFVTWDVRVLWFYAGNYPGIVRGVICSHWCPKLKKKEFNKEARLAQRRRNEYLEARRRRQLGLPSEEK